MRAEDAQVLVAGRRAGELRRFATEIGGYAVCCDITKPEDVTALADTAVEAMGGVTTVGTPH